MAATGPDPPTAELFLFGPFALDGFARTLLSHDLAVPLQPKTFELLQFLVRNAGRLLSKAEILDALWPGEPITEGNLTQQMFLLRSTLARHSPRETYIVTASGRGYRFVAPVETRQLAVERDDLEANQFYARARYFFEKRSADAMHRSIHYFRRAVEADPHFSRAYAGLASAYALSGEYFLIAPTQAFPRAAAAARRALELEPTLADAHTVLGEVASYYERDYESADRHFAKATALAPNSSNTIVMRTWFLCIMGRADEATDLLRDALIGEPYSLAMRTSLAIASLFRRAYPEAIEQLKAVLDMDGDYVYARFYLGVALQLESRDAEVIELNRGYLPDGFEQQFMALRGSSLARLGRLEEARTVEDAMRALVSRGRFVSCFNLAWIALGSGEFDHAIGLLEAAFEQRDPWLVFLPASPLFDALRGDRRFDALALRVRS